jgi:RimJ/RimL family protein N-acetyltransferase
MRIDGDYEESMSSFAPRHFATKTHQNLLVRAGVIDDAARILEIAHAVLADGEFTITEPDELPSSEDQEREWIRQLLDAPGKILLVGVIADSLVGIINFENGHRRRIAHRGSLHMSVLEEWRDQGIGRALLQSLIQWAEEQPILEKLCLSVLATNARGIKLYLSLGFVEEGRCPRSVKVGPGHYVDEILMYRFVRKGNRPEEGSL